MTAPARCAGGAERCEGAQLGMAGVRLAPCDGGCPVALPPGETLLGRGPLLGVSEGGALSWALCRAACSERFGPPLVY